MFNSICKSCEFRYICGASDISSDINLYEVPDVFRDDITKCVIDCNCFSKDNLL